MTRKLLQAILVVFGIVTIVAFLMGCDKKNPMTGPTPTTTCEDSNATNRGGPLPCTYPPPKVVELPGAPLWGQVGPGGYAAVVKVPAYPGRVEAQVVINDPPTGTYPMRLLLSNPPPPDGDNRVFKSVVAPITLVGTISLSHDGTMEARAWIQNTGTVFLNSVTVKFYYIRD